MLQPIPAAASTGEYDRRSVTAPMDRTNVLAVPQGTPLREALGEEGKDGADDPTRTGNRLITIQLLCQLSYVGILWAAA